METKFIASAVQRLIGNGRALVWLIVLAAAFAGNVANAQFASGGSGLHKGRIFWVDFGNVGENISPSRTITRGFNAGSPASSANRFEVTCTVSNISTTRGSPGLFVYNPGSWQGDGLDDLYNIGGAHQGTGPNPNTLSIGLRPSAGSTTEFDFNCSATLAGAGFPLNGLVFSDAEASGGPEYIAARLTNGGTLRIIDSVSACGRPGTVNVIAGPPQEVRLVPGAAGSCENNATPSLRAGPVLVGFVDGATRARVVAYGGGISAIAVGAVLELEFSEAIPSSYGVAAHVVDSTWTGGEAVTGRNYVDQTNLARPTPSPPRLGPTTQPDADASGAVGGPDVDALPKTTGPAGAGYANVASPTARGAPYTISNVNCTGPGVVAGWIDFNGNGVFDPSEKSAVAACPSGSSNVALSWTVPAGAGYVAQPTSYLRLRVAPTAAGITNPTGLTSNGETEDYRIALVRPAADMSAVLSGFPASAAPGSTVTGTLVCTAAAGNPAEGATCAPTGLPSGATVSCTPTPPIDVAPGSSITCSISFAVPATGLITITGTTGATNDSVATNNSVTAPVKVVDAVNDSAASIPSTGARIPLLANDTLGGAPITLGATGNANAPTIVSGAPPGSTIDPATGELVVPAGTPPGSYSVVYSVCAKDVPAACDQATLTISVPAADMSASLTGFPQSAAPGSTVTGVLRCTASGTTALNATCAASGLPAGAVVACTPTPPANVPAGSSITCNVSFTAPASGLINVTGTTGATNDSNNSNNSAASPVKVVNAVNEPPTTVSTTGGLVPLLGNDTVGAGPAVIGTGGISPPTLVSGAPPGATINASGQLVVPPGTPAGTYNVTYRICAQDTPAACDTAVAVVTIAAADMAVTLSGFPASASPGSPVSGTLTCTASGNTALGATCNATGLPAGAQVQCTPPPPADVAAGQSIVCAVSFTTPANGLITITGTTGATNDSNAGNNSTSTPVKVIDANNDSFTVTLPTVDGQPARLSLLPNDTLSGSPVVIGSTVSAPTLVSSTIPGATIDPATGQLVIPAATPAGTYVVRYRVCAIDTPTACDEASATVNVPASDMSVAVSGFPAFAAPGSTVSGTVTCTASGNTALGATCSAAGLPSGAAVACTPTPPVNLAAGSAITCSVSFTAPANGAVNVTGTTDAANDTVPGNNNASTPVRIINAVADGVVTISAGGGTVPLLTNDTLGGAPATIGAGGINLPTLLSGAPPGATVDGQGRIVVAPGTPAGTYLVTYQICANTAPTVCDTATVTIDIPTADMAISLTGFPPSAAPGSSVSGRAICTAAGNAALNATCGVAGLPPGATVVCTPPSPAASLPAGSSIVCEISFTASATGVVNVAGTTGATNDSNPANNTAAAPIRVIDAVNDAPVTLSTAGGTVALIGNDTLGGAPTAIGPTGITVPAITADGGLVGATVNAAGQLVVPPGTRSGTYSVTYQICAQDRPTACDSAVAQVSVNVQPPSGVKYGQNASNPGLPLTAGQQIDWTIVYRNTDSAPLTLFQVTDVLDANLSNASIVSVVSASGLVANPGYTGVGAAVSLLAPGGSLAANDTLTIRIRATVNAGFTGQLANQANATSSVLTAPITTSAVSPATPPCPAATACLPVGVVVPPNAFGGQPTAPNQPAVASVVQSATLSGQIWLDANSDRARQANEPAAVGYQVAVYRLNADGTRGPEVTDPANRPKTDAAGNYTVPNLIPTQGAGPKYEVVFLNQAGNLVLGVPAAQNPDPALNGTVPPTRDRITGVSLTPGANTSGQNLPLDPAGVVYDSVTRLPIPGATVTISGPPGFNPATQLVGGTATQVTGADGYYQFILGAGAPAGNYTVSVTPPNGYGPSQLIPPGAPATPGAAGLCPGAVAGTPCPVQPQPGAPQVGVNPSTTYFVTFNLTPGVSPDVVHNHIPLDPASNVSLAIIKIVDKSEAEIGDAVKYTIRVKNLSASSAVPQLQVFDRLPLGFKYVPKTTRSIALPPVALADPAGSPGPSLTFALGSIPAGGETSFTYYVRIGVGGADGDGINRAYAQSGAIRSLTAQAQVKVRGGVFGSEACIVGKIFVDCGADGVGFGNGNSLQDRGEPGIPGVRFYLQDGSYVVSDSEGKYSLCGLQPRTQVLKVDQTTLPQGSRLGTTANRNAGDAGSLFIDLKNGQLQRADFRDMSCNASVFDEVARRRAAAPRGGQEDVNRPRFEGPGQPGSGLGLQPTLPGSTSGATVPGSSGGLLQRKEGVK